MSRYTITLTFVFSTMILMACSVGDRRVPPSKTHCSMGATGSTTPASLVIVRPADYCWMQSSMGDDDLCRGCPEGKYMITVNLPRHVRRHHGIPTRGMLAVCLDPAPEQG